MIYFTHAEIDHLITEDLPLHDETTRALGLPDVPGTLTYVARKTGVLAGAGRGRTDAARQECQP